MTSTASGSWRNYQMADEYMHVTNLFLKNFITIAKYLAVGLEFWVLQYQITGS
jgi:hypothetical protein